METHIFKVPMAEVSYSDGVLYVDYSLAPKVELEDVQELTNCIATNFVAHLPTLVMIDISQVKSASKEARAHMASPTTLSLFKANAIIANSMLAKILGNLYLTFNKPSCPTKIFSNKETGLKWLQQFR